ncbi:hypothetical protein ACFWG6_07675 [Streptomyces erythrochromogenes]|uniref:hypothetical protein n=1 Tax=Streptomyces erythrochromogenes TaxID=285574 RepID=UPI0036443FD3
MNPGSHTPLRDVAPVCVLSPSPARASSKLPAEQTMAALAASTAHLARRLKAASYPAS